MAAPHIQRIDHSNLRENAYAALRDAFTAGAFAPGDSVSLRALADQLGTSMTPVREAVRRLVAEGALIDTPSRTLAVPDYDEQRMRDLKAARLALESLVLDQAMNVITHEDVDKLEALITAPPDVDGPDLQRNYEFHFALYRLGGSRVLLPMVEALWLQYGAYLNLVIGREEARQIDEHAHHRDIIDALRHRDAHAAHAALNRDIERSFQILLPDGR
ncbi:MAG: GntR family transcriptional regulator [Paracoccaceae bacterium]|nr:GntR family transcriptional regulator [Paracoccaceae bacterium]